MKIHQLLDGMNIIITNEEHNFIKHNGDRIFIAGLEEHDQWIAQNLLRKGVYKINKDNTFITKNDNQ